MVWRSRRRGCAGKGVSDDVPGVRATSGMVIKEGRF